MTSWNGNIFRVTSPFCGAFAGHQWIPRTNASDAELWCFLWSAPEQTVEWTIETSVIWNVITLIMRSLQCKGGGGLLFISFVLLYFSFYLFMFQLFNIIFLLCTVLYHIALYFCIIECSILNIAITLIDNWSLLQIRALPLMFHCAEIIFLLHCSSL